jgi:hypothetical protein
LLAVRKEAVSLMRLVKNYNSDKLYCRPECHVVLNAFSISKNSTPSDILLFKFRVTWSTSLICWSVILWAWKLKGSAFDKFLSAVFLHCS